MSNQYYNFLIKKLLKWMETTSINAGDRYYITLNDQREVNYFIDAFNDQKLEKTKEFNLYLEDIDYSTVSFMVNKLKIVIANTDEKVTNDFLVTLRNKVGEQKGIWENTALLFVCDDVLDSIVGGASSLTKTGSPFHPNTMRRDIREEIKSTNLSTVEKLILQTIVDENFKETEDMTRLTLLDFESVYSLLYQESLTPDNYNQLGYFFDEQIQTYQSDEDVIKKRLKENKEIYGKIENFHTSENVKDRITGIVDGENLINKLSKSNWMEIDYESVKKGEEELKKVKKTKINYLEENLSKVNQGFEVWDKSNETDLNKSVTKRKQRNLIIFVNPSLTDITFRLPFDDSVKKSSYTKTNTYLYKNNYMLREPEFSYDTTGKNLVISIKDYDSESLYFGLITYKHENLNPLTFKFSFTILPFASNLINQIKTNYKISVNKKKQQIEIINNIESLIIGNGEITERVILRRKNENVELSSDISSEIDFKKYQNETDEINIDFNLIYNNLALPISMQDNSPINIPKSAISIEKYRRENTEEMQYDLGQLNQGTSTYYPFKKHKQFLEYENKLIEDNIFYASMEQNELTKIDIELPLEVKEAYLKLFEVCKNEQTLLSICSLKDDISEAINNIYRIISKILSDLKESERIEEQIRNIFKIGQIYDKDKDIILVSPINPMLIVYNKTLDTEITSEELPESIINRLNSKNLLPFIEEENKLYESYYDKEIPRWLFYNALDGKQNKLSYNTRNIVSSKLKDFYKHFKYLFEVTPEIALNIQIINITDEKEILIGVIDYILSGIKAGTSLKNLNTINIYVQTNQSINTSDFKYLFSINSVLEFEEFFGKNLKKYINGLYSEVDLIDTIKNKINVFYNASENHYYHITFYKFEEAPRQSSYETDRLLMNYSLSGLTNSMVFTKNNQEYLTGFGTDGDRNSSDLINFMSLWNSFSLAVRSEGINTYRRNESVVNNIQTINYQDLKEVFDNSSWVTFVNPNVDLSYFTDNNQDLFIIHYTDQTNSQSYESITITKKIYQYEDVLKENLYRYHKEYSEDDIENIIRSFNILNGEWLLNIIGQKKNPNIIREKLSIISAYKNALAILDSPNFYWIPISLEEILRVSRMVGLDKSSDLFSNKILDYNGATSDDLLFMGVEITDTEDIKVHFLPIEVKIGMNYNNVLTKAKKQIKQTYNIFKNELVDKNKTLFKKKFYRNFFIQIYLSNLEKFIDNRLWEDKNYKQVYEYREKLLNDKFEISEEINEIYGKGMVFSFKNENHYRRIDIEPENEITIVSFTETDAYLDIKSPIEKIVKDTKNNRRSLPSDKLLKHLMLANKKLEVEVEATEKVIDTEISVSLYTESNETLDSKIVEAIDDEPIESLDTEASTEASTEVNIEDSDLEDSKEGVAEFNKILDEKVKSVISTGNNKLSEARILIGNIKGSNEKLYWEYGHPKLANRHLLISGKSGQGKTYFMQCMLYELSKQKISSLVIDYTNGFVQNQLEQVFVDRLDDKLKQYIVYTDLLPINPFKKQQIDLGTGTKIDESTQDMVDRTVQVVDFVFDLGIQQKHLLGQIITDAYSMNGEKLTFTHIKNRLVDAEDSGSKTLLGRISPLLDRDPFSYKEDSFNWNNVYNDKGEVHIIQLVGFQKNVQRILTEFLLWDLYNFSVSFGNKNRPLPILLDEAQNLNHKSDSPATKIMKEGRKFGWSAWFATQSLSAIKKAGGDLSGLYNAQEQIHFLPTEDQISYLAGILSSDNQSKSGLEQTLSDLQKGQCLVSGPAIVNGELKNTIQILEISPLEER